MRRLTLSLVLLLTTAATPLCADDAALRLEGTRFVGKAEWEQIDAWIKARAALGREGVAGAEKAEQAAAAQLGKAWPWTLVCNGERAVLDLGANRHIARFEAPAFRAQLTIASRQALVVNAAFARQMNNRSRTAPIKLEPADGKSRTLFGKLCQSYVIGGNGRGAAWIHKLEGAQLARAKAYAKAVVATFGKQHGELWLAALDQHGGVPIVAQMEGVRGNTLSGFSTGAAQTWVCWTIADGKLPAKAIQVPKGWAVTKLPPR